jgi:hypothetical protein
MKKYILAIYITQHNIPIQKMEKRSMPASSAYNAHVLPLSPVALACNELNPMHLVCW